MQLLQSSDEVNSKTLVWTKGMKNWSYLEKVFPSSPSQLLKNANSSGADRNFYYLGKNEETLGPFSIEDLSKLLRRGEIMSSTMLWTPDQKEYITLSTALPHLLPRSHAVFPNNQIQSETRFGSRQESSVPSTSQAVKDEGHENTLTFISDEQTFSPTQDENLFMGRPATRLENVNSEIQGEVLSQAESIKDYDASLEKRVLKLQLELASANAELSHTKDVMQAERNKEPQEIVSHWTFLL